MPWRNSDDSNKYISDRLDRIGINRGAMATKGQTAGLLNIAFGLRHMDLCVLH